jgi:hypothetical protein
MKTAVDYAREMVSSGQYRETHGKNRSPALDALVREYGYPLGIPWCAIWVSEAFDKAADAGAPGLRLAPTAGSQAMLAWFKRLQKREPDFQWISSDPQDALNWEGAILIRTDPDGEHGHVALAERRLTTAGKIVAFGTLEGNTDSDGGRDGDAAYERKRPVPLKPYRWTLCNTTKLAGGSYW